MLFKVYHLLYLVIKLKILLFKKRNLGLFVVNIIYIKIKQLLNSYNKFFKKSKAVHENELPLK